MNSLSRATLALALNLGLMLGGGVALAQTPVTGAANAEALFSSPDPKLNRNKQAAYHIMKELLEANHWEMADQYLTERYIQHNPNAGNGRAAVVKFFTEVMKVKPTPIPATLMKTKVVSVLAEGDYVMVSIAREYPEPKDPNKTYTSTWFDMWRFVDGKADEHWDGATKQ